MFWRVCAAIAPQHSRLGEPEILTTFTKDLVSVE
jgi:hypothetical protein